MKKILPPRRDAGPLPSGIVLPMGKPRPTDTSFAQAMRAWRQAKTGFERDILWIQLGMAAGAVNLSESNAEPPNPFLHGLRQPSALHEAVVSGSLDAIDLIAAMTGNPALLSERLNECHVDLGSHRNTLGETVISHAWLGSSAHQGTSEPMIRKLVSLGAHPDGCSVNLGLPLRGCISMGDVSGARAHRAWSRPSPTCS
jgi:hypothetical protein